MDRGDEKHVHKVVSRSVHIDVTRGEESFYLKVYQEVSKAVYTEVWHKAKKGLNPVGSQEVNIAVEA